ncbi:caffeic acid 3-O-methyltransferase-like [Phalaenopsis equestris]|uniref:caffeic acid 3-O-methyltransferase-like n=1 Tax=Phalaenopsis equestris TaxID=78828 RepID=UPI0009E1E1CA|nr:caffeic acid 3-O-methyltransferase-like [Phalaenopsis equestris]
MRNITTKEDEAFAAAMQLCVSNIFCSAVKAAFDLGIFDILAMAGPNSQLTAVEIAGNLPECRHEKAAIMLEPILGYLATHSLLTCTTNSSLKQYGLTPVSRLLTKNNHGASLAPLMLVANQKAFIDSWDHLKEAVQEGVNPFKRTHGLTLFEYMAKNPSFCELFNKGMASSSNMVIEKLVEEYGGLKQVKELVDVGGGNGTSLKMIISKYPYIKGINFDLPHVVSEAPSFPGVQHVGGDMFIMIPSGGTILLKWILHDWNDEECLKILKNCWGALPTFGKVIIVEQILPEIIEENIVVQHSYAMNLIMMTIADAKERTEKEYRSLAKKANFSEFKIACKVLNHYVMEFVK